VISIKLYVHGHAAAVLYSNVFYPLYWFVIFYIILYVLSNLVSYGAAAAVSSTGPTAEKTM